MHAAANRIAALGIARAIDVKNIDAGLDAERRCHLTGRNGESGCIAGASLCDAGLTNHFADRAQARQVIFRLGGPATHAMFRG